MVGKVSRNKEICELADGGATYQELSEKFNISKARIGAIIHQDKRLARIFNDDEVGRLLWDACEKSQCRDYIGIYNALHRHFGRHKLDISVINDFYFSGGHVHGIGKKKEKVIFEMLRCI